MSPDQYWRQFMHTVFFDEPKKIEGVVEARSQDGPDHDPYPVIVLREQRGWKLKVNVTQVRLLSELVRAALPDGPQVGDHVEIIYHGPAPKAAPGRSPVKEFSVYVTPKGSPPQAQAVKPSGEVEPERAPAAGSTPKG